MSESVAVMKMQHKLRRYGKDESSGMYEHVNRYLGQEGEKKKKIALQLALVLAIRVFTAAKFRSLEKRCKIFCILRLKAKL